jgi:CheY-like chemotaxis protein
MADGPILVVDDDDDIRDALVGLLRDAGHPVVEAMDGRQALDVARSSLPRMILLDLMMPVMDGYEFLAERAKHVSLVDIPVVVITASGTRSVPGASGVLHKPFNVDDLLAVVK